MPRTTDTARFFPDSTTFCENYRPTVNSLNFPVLSFLLPATSVVISEQFRLTLLKQFLPAVIKDSARASGDPVPLRKLSKAPFAVAMEPDIVSDASFAVVPVIPNFRLDNVNRLCNICKISF